MSNALKSVSQPIFNVEYKLIENSSYRKLEINGAEEGT
jgi:hypothetical protein